MGDFASNDDYVEPWEQQVSGKIGGCLMVVLMVAFLCSLPRIVALLTPAWAQVSPRITEVLRWLGWLGS